MSIDISDTETLVISPTKDILHRELVLEIMASKICFTLQDKGIIVKNTVTSNTVHI